MGRVLSRALAAAGLADYQARVLLGEALTDAELASLRGVDLLLIAALADVMRAQCHGDEVRIVSSKYARHEHHVLFDRVPTAAGATGAELLRELALLRLGTPADISVAVSMETLGLELAQTALLFGADMLVGEIEGERPRTLPLLDGASARRRELEGLIARSGRRATFVEHAAQPVHIQPTPHTRVEQTT